MICRPSYILELEKLLNLDFLPDQQRADSQKEYMLYLINGGPGIQNYQTMKETEPEAENEVPIILSDVEESTSETSYEMFERRQRQVPITRPFVSRNVSCSSNSSQSFSSSSSQLINSGRVTRGSATKRSKATVTADEEDDNVDYFSVPKKGREGKK